MANRAARDGNFVPTIIGVDDISGNPSDILSNGRALYVYLAGALSSLSITTTSPQVQTLLDDVTTTSMTYVGTAAIGTATSASAWTIKRIDESGTPTTLVVKWATSGASTCIWDNRAALSYS